MKHINETLKHLMKQLSAVETLITHEAEWMHRLDLNVLLSFLLHSHDDKGIYIVNFNQRLLYCNNVFMSLTGITPLSLHPDFFPDELHISASGRRFISFAKHGKQEQDLAITTQVLIDKTGHSVGGIGMISTALIESDTQTSANQRNLNFHGIISHSPAMKSIFQIIQNAAQTEATVLVRGESGAGKELVAKAIHQLSTRRDAPFLAINCAALSSNLLESELFGHVRGAFTGAIKDHDGLFKRANGGTLFLDEVAEMPLELQAKLLRVIQERNYVPVGGSHSINVDVRIVAATHRSLREEVKLGHFREDLMYRLRVVPIFLPPLRDRREDIGLLIWHFINKHNDKRIRVIEKIDPEAIKMLLDYRWPGNVRELHNVVEYAFAVGRGSTLRLSELPPEFKEKKTIEYSNPTLKKTVNRSAEEEPEAIKKALTECQGRAGDAANMLGMSRATFWRKRKRYHL